MTRPRRIYLDMVGCRVNQSELERIGGQARQAGHELVGEIADADVAILNTCAVTRKAASESRKLARKIQRNGVREIILTGCWASLEPDSAASLPGVTSVVSNLQKDQLHLLALDPIALEPELEPAQRQPLPGARKRTRAFIKAQDGCDKHCTFCITTVARGASRSEPLTRILTDIHAAVTGDAKEIILTGVHLGAWGLDLIERDSLEHLIRSILYHTDIPRLRISSLEPWGLSDSLLALWEDPRLCQQLHLPLQSGSMKILRRMARNSSPDRYKSLVERIRQRFPRLAITTDIIVGFPGERDPEFEESLSFVKSMQYASGHVFTYSEVPGTAAASFPDQIRHPIRRERNQRMRSAIEESSIKYRSSFLDSSVSVLWESLIALDAEGWTLNGHSSEGMRIQARGSPSALNQINNVHIRHLTDGGVLFGSVTVSV